MFRSGSLRKREEIHRSLWIEAQVDVWKWIANYDGRFKWLIPMREALAESRNAVAIWLSNTPRLSHR